MMKNMILKQYVADAFTDEVFSGNPAAICILDSWIPDELMMNITKENNLSETAFAVRNGEKYELRWFTPGGEIDLCGHATLACAFIILNYYDKDENEVVFSTMSGELKVVRRDDLYEMDFPAYQIEPYELTDEISEALGAVPEAVYIGRDLLCVMENEETVRKLTPDLDRMKKLDGLLLHVTAEAENGEYDCISRSFAPKMNVPEDPVCGSGHCHIVPYWSDRLMKNDIAAYQASARGGVLYCRRDSERIVMAGKAVLYSEAVLHI